MDFARVDSTLLLLLLLLLRERERQREKKRFVRRGNRASESLFSPPSPWWNRSERERETRHAQSLKRAVSINSARADEIKRQKRVGGRENAWSLEGPPRLLRWKRRIRDRLLRNHRRIIAGWILHSMINDTTPLGSREPTREREREREIPPQVCRSNRGPIYITRANSCQRTRVSRRFMDCFA